MLRATHGASETVHYWAGSGQSERLPCNRVSLMGRGLCSPQLFKGGTSLPSQPKVEKKRRRKLEVTHTCDASSREEGTGGLLGPTGQPASPT